MEVRRVTSLKWRNLLGTSEGAEGIAYIRGNTPVIPVGEAIAIAFNAGRNQGYGECISRMYELAEANDPKEKDESELLNKGLE